MLRAVAIAGTMIVVAVGLLTTPATAKKNPPPAKFETTGTLVTSNPLTLRRVGITRTQFVETCAVPETQGVDGYVIELPKPLTKVASSSYLTGTDLSGQPDLDMYYFDDACEEIGYTSTSMFSETGVIPAGTHYVLVTAFFGAAAEFSFETVEIRS